jgi:DNA modification methylase
MAESGAWEVHCLDSREMHPVATGSCAMVLTSPPYFPAGVEVVLRSGRVRDAGALADEVRGFVEGLAPVFREMARVLRPDGRVALITRYLSAGGVQIPVTCWFRQLMEREGFVVGGRFFLRKHARRSPGQRAGDFLRGAEATPVGVEDVMVYRRANERRGGARMVRGEVTAEEVTAWLEPLWSLSSPGAGRRHPHQMPREAGRRLILLYSRPGDVVLDPFAGAAGLLLDGPALGRRVIACELDPRYAVICREQFNRVSRTRRTS